MCSPTPCRACGKVTWSGCGSHINEVRAYVPADQWCGGQCEPSDVTSSLTSTMFNTGGGTR